MEIYNADIDIDLLEFSDRFGTIRSTAGCSFKGKVEFDTRLKLLGEIITKSAKETPDKSIAEIYQENKEFAHHCDRCLKLNGINPKWLTEAHLTELLFLHDKKPGVLVVLNTANNPNSGEKSTSEGKIYHQFLAALYNFTQNPEQAFRLAEERPFKEVSGMIKEVGNREEKAAGRATTNPRPQAKNGKPEISDRSRINLMALRDKTKATP